MQDSQSGATGPNNIPASDVDPYSVANIMDPYPMHEVLRELAPVVWLSRYNVCAIARYEAMRDALLDPGHFVSGAGVGLSDIRKPEAWRTAGPLAESDPPHHTTLRRAMNRIFNIKAIRSWRQAFLQEAEKLVDDVVARPSFDLVSDLVEPYVFNAFTAALGVELDRERVIIVGNHSFNSSGPKNEIFEASLERANGVSEWLAEKRQRSAMKPGGFGAAVFAAEEDGEIPPGSASGMLLTLIRGGMDTTVSGLASTVRLIQSHPETWSTLKGDPAYGGACFEEAVRLESPVQSNYRTTVSKPLTFHGAVIPPDTKVLLFHSAANRDPRVWKDASRFLPGKRPPETPHLAFGHGEHFCLGRNLARLEAQCLLEVLSAKAERLEQLGEPEYRPVNALRTLDRLEMRALSRSAA